MISFGYDKSMSKTKNKPMSVKNYWYVAGVVVLLVLGYWFVWGGNENRNFWNGGAQNGGASNQINRGNCLADDCLMVQDLEYPAGELPKNVEGALNEAINDEYKALATYEVVMDKFGVVRPFAMIKGAEEQHIASLKAIFDKYGIKVPANTWMSKVSVPATLQEACQVGVDAEIANAALYKDKLLPEVGDYADIVAVFTNLMNASEMKHLPAFEKCK